MKNSGGRVPLGHTKFSFTAGSSENGRVPESHTSFSWFPPLQDIRNTARRDMSVDDVVENQSVKEAEKAQIDQGNTDERKMSCPLTLLHPVQNHLTDIDDDSVLFFASGKYHG